MTEPLCPTCNDTGRILHFWWKPGGVGNGWAGCTDCETGRAWDEQRIATLEKIHLTQSEQRVMEKALRASTRIIA